MMFSTRRFVLTLVSFSQNVQHDRAVYDVLYLVLALREGISLITADERFVSALKPKGFSLILLSEWSVSLLNEEVS
jgi:predicted nucleic acid-binding protein